MTVLELIKSNPDIYDALVDVYGIDLIEVKYISALTDAINQKIEWFEACISDYLENGIHEETDEEPTTLNNHIAVLAMIRGFVSVMLYRETEQYTDDEFFNLVLDIANDYYEPLAGRPLSIDTCKMFIDLDIRNGDDLSDEGGEFNELEYEAFESGLDMVESFDRK